jgi:oligoendopeptidase F
MRKVYLFCYVGVVDEFQHWVYENPEASMERRDEEWNRIWDVYQPGLDFEGLEAYKYARWYMQEHIFRFPFYYIDYQLADMAAMQIAVMDRKDHKRAMDVYMHLCRLGGTLAVLDTFKAVGLRSPFEPGLMQELMAHAARELE